MDEVVGVEADAEQEDERVVATSNEEQGDHVHGGENTGPVTGVVVPQLRVAPFDSPDAEGDLHSEVAKEEHCLKTAREGAHVGGCRQLELAVVSLFPERRSDDVALDLGVVVTGDAEVLLLAIAGGAVVEVGESSHVTEEHKSPSVRHHGGENSDPGPGCISHDLHVGLLGDGVVCDLSGSSDWCCSHGIGERCCKQRPCE